MKTELERQLAAAVARRTNARIALAKATTLVEARRGFLRRCKEMRELKDAKVDARNAATRLATAESEFDGVLTEYLTGSTGLPLLDAARTNGHSTAMAATSGGIAAKEAELAPDGDTALFWFEHKPDDAGGMADDRVDFIAAPVGGWTVGELFLAASTLRPGEVFTAKSFAVCNRCNGIRRRSSDPVCPSCGSMEYRSYDAAVAELDPRPESREDRQPIRRRREKARK